MQKPDQLELAGTYVDGHGAKVKLRQGVADAREDSLAMFECSFFVASTGGGAYYAGDGPGIGKLYHWDGPNEGKGNLVFDPIKPAEPQQLGLFD